MVFANMAKIQPQQYLKISIGLFKVKKPVPVILVMSAASDLLAKSILIPKLRAHGFTERVIAIYNDFLSDRKAVV
jgi:hypothetical protein